MDLCTLIMAGSLNGLQLWLPTEEELFNTESNPVPSFPVEFPYEFDSFGSSNFESTDTESSDEDEFLVGLTRRLTQQLAGEPKKKWVMVGSPKSILSGTGSWSMSSNGSSNGEVSPPTTPFASNNDTLDLICTPAAGDFARLKMSSEMNHSSNYRGRNPANGVKNQSTGFYTNQRFVPGVSQLNQYQNQQRRRNFIGYETGRSFLHPLGLPQSAWPPLQSPQNKHNPTPTTATGGFVGGSGAKRGCNGTGVFLPRRYGNAPINNKKSDCSTVLLPAKIGEPPNLKIEDLNRQRNSTSQSFKGVLEYNNYGEVARRNGLMEQEKGNLQAESAVKNEICLPQEWIY